MSWHLYDEAHAAVGLYELHVDFGLEGLQALRALSPEGYRCNGGSYFL